MPQHQRADAGPARDHAELRHRVLPREHRERSGHRDRAPDATAGEATGHRPDGDGDDGHGGELEASDETGVAEVEGIDAVRERDERDRRRKREADPGGDSAQQPGSQHADADADLTARRAGQDLAESHEVRVGALAEPATPDHVLIVEGAEVRPSLSATRSTSRREWRAALVSVVAIASLDRPRRPRRSSLVLVPGVGLEPTRPEGQRILSPSRLPIPPPRHRRG